MNDEQLLRYSRHILLDPIGIEGQDRLLGSRVLIVGAGGLGCPAALYMAAAGVGTIVIADDDEVDLTNLQRQVLYRLHSVGRAKAESARDALRDVNSGIEILALKQRLEGRVLMAQVEAADVVLDCSDNFLTRHAINRACVAARTPLVSGAAIRFDGQVAVFDSREDAAPCYHCLFPEEGETDEVRCAVMGVFAPLTGIIGTVQAAEALKLLARTGTSLAGRLLLLDALTMTWRSIALSRDPACVVCRRCEADQCSLT
jgi:adenylyltransferase/sulfurtransferase